jgi:hypothetical protein
MTIDKTPRHISDMKLEADPTAPEKLFYLSFAGSSCWLGGMFIVAKSATGAVLASHFLGNPGGEVMVMELPEEARASLAPNWLRRLLTRADLGELGQEMAKLLN